MQNSNVEVERVSCINVKHKFHKGLKHQKIYFWGQSYQKILIEPRTGEKSQITIYQMGFFEIGY